MVKVFNDSPFFRENVSLFLFDKKNLVFLFKVLKFCKSYPKKDISISKPHRR